jgi:transposase InsO family protein
MSCRRWKSCLNERFSAPENVRQNLAKFREHYNHLRLHGGSAA